MTATKPAGAEQRQEPRFKVSIVGWISPGGGLRPIRCELLDLSVSGAQVRMSGKFTLPQSVRMLETKNGNTFECQVKWQKDNYAGLHFVDVCSRLARRELIDVAGTLPNGKSRPRA